jgi:hypothetical protein
MFQKQFEAGREEGIIHASALASIKKVSNGQLIM